MRGIRRLVMLWGIVLLQFGLTAPARAALVDFEGEALSFYGAGDPPFTSGGTQFTLIGGFGGVTDNASFMGLAPTGNGGQYLAVFNEGNVVAQRVGGLFSLLSLDYAYIASGLPSDASTRLSIAATAWNGDLLEVLLDIGAADGDGLYSFRQAGAGALGALGTTALQSISFQACVFDAGACTPVLNASQFALDNLEIAAVPLPATLALVLLGLAVMAGVSRRAR